MSHRLQPKLAVLPREQRRLWPELRRAREVGFVLYGGIGFGRIGTPDLTADGVAEAASLVDLMATKLKVVLQRAEAKDYRDVAAMIRAGVDLSQGLAGAQTLFGAAFQPNECLKALTFFEDGGLPSLTKAEEAALIGASRSVVRLTPAPLLSTALAAAPPRFARAPASI